MPDRKRWSSNVGVYSITMHYDGEKPLESIMKPLGGCGIAKINGFDLVKCQMAREKNATVITYRK